MAKTLALPDNWNELVSASRAVREKAYAPYSGFQVGAAVQTENGQIFVGCNVENASHGLTICAERVAMSVAVAAGQREPQVVCVSLTGDPVPCGACRQFLYEFNPAAVLLLDNVGSSGPPEAIALETLFPRGFRLD